MKRLRRGHLLLLMVVVALVLAPAAALAATHITGTAGDDELDGTPGDDIVRAVNEIGDASDYQLSAAGGRGDDHIIAGQGEDVVFAGRGDDTIDTTDFGNDHSEKVRCGKGFDTVIASPSDWVARDCEDVTIIGP